MEDAGTRRRAWRPPARGIAGARTSPSAPGARSARTTAPTATRGPRSRTTTPVRAPTAGTRTAWPASRTSFNRLNLALALWNGQRPDPQGADVRADQQRGQPRRGRQGVLVVPRRGAQPAPGCAGATTTPGGVPVRATWSRRTAGAPSWSPSTSCSTPASSTTTATGSSRSDYAKADPDDVLMRVTVRNMGPEAATLHVLPTLWFRNDWSWDPERWPPPILARPTATTIRAAHPELGDYLARGRARRRMARRPELLFCENETNTPRIFGTAADHAVSRRTASTTTSSSGAATVNPARTGHQGRGLVPGHGGGRRDGRAPAPDCGRRVRGRRGHRRPSGRGSPRRMRDREAEADEFYADLDRAGRDRRGVTHHAPGVRGHALEQAVLRLQRGALARRRPGPAAAAAGAADRPQRRLAALRRGRHPVHARPLGVPVVRGLGPRLPRDHPRPRRPGVRQVPAAGAVPGVVPAPERRAAGVRVDVRRRQPAGPRRSRRCRSGRSTARGTCRSWSGSSTSC